MKCISQKIFWNWNKQNQCSPCLCDICGKNDGVILGHIVSKNNGGTYNLQNLLWTCHSCEDTVGSNNIKLSEIFY